MSNEALKYIFSDSACLTAKQMKHYVQGHMANEESHAVEMHLNSCPFCNEAIEGLFEQQEGSAAEAVVSLNSNFLSEHFSLHNPQIHLNSMAPAQPVVQAHPRRRRKINVQPLWRPSSIAAAILLAFAGLWYFEFGQHLSRNRQIAQHTNTAASTGAPQTAGSDQANNPEQQSQMLAGTETGQQSDLQAGKAEGTVANNSNNPGTQQPVIITDKDAVKEQEPAKGTTAAQKKEDTNNEEVVVRSYKAPLIDAYSDGRTGARQAEEIEKTPARTMNEVASAAPSAKQKKADDIYNSDNNDNAELAEAKRSASADDLYSQGKYTAALSMYKQEMNDGSRGKRQRAAVQAARCHLALGHKNTAIQMLRSIVDEGGPQKRAAKRLLSELEGNNGE